MGGKYDNKEEDRVRHNHSLLFWEIREGVILKGDITKVRINVGHNYFQSTLKSLV